jgi:hypothetical protein
MANNINNQQVQRDVDAAMLAIALGEYALARAIIRGELMEETNNG